MPVYTYRREDGSTFDIRQRFSDDALERCPETGQKVTRLVQAAGIIFRGSGFYVNDSKKSANGKTGKTGEGGADKKEKSPVKAEKKDAAPAAKTEKAAPGGGDKS
ncbi:MAG: zinc ribbon domain-containing protein [Anaerolineaceae bacterium]|nr:zinc ribbon domain-containing protein [Anaerolineaceae bacterium]MDE0327525.1 zinc ribbon domain-containing protein [Anaerolineaceae bacterium]MDE0610595.1 zinc ribbon domain-containing protein [Anaerolineaceae bacterium]